MTGNVPDDEALLAALRQALSARQAVPAEFIAMAKSAFAWHNIDAELARLTYDSVRDSASLVRARAEEASIRALTFTSAHLTIELEVTGDSVLGQVIPAQAASIRVQPAGGAETVVRLDEIGCFSISPIPVGSFRLLCRTAAGVEVSTAWLVL
jgi:hypothetical protein